tara:strand:+ start:28315 stop:29730 length:1416 start_codon:yes stop_codon:yes gene_type:complete
LNLKVIAGFALGPIGTALLSFISLPLITWFFSSEDIGRIAMLQVFTSFFVLILSLGLDQSFVREYHDVDDKPALFKSALLPGLVLFFLVLFVWLFSPFSIAKYLFDLENLAVELIVIFCLFMAFISRFLSLILRMQERGVAFSMSQLLPKALFLAVILGYMLTISDFTFFHLIVAHSISIIFVAMILLWGTRDTVVKAIVAKINIKKLQSMLHFGMPLIIGGAAFWGLTAMDKLFLRSLSTFSELALYSVAVSFATAAIIFQNIFSTIWAPTVYKWAISGINDEKIDLVTDYVTLAVLLLFSLAGLFSWLILYMLPAEYKSVQYILVCCMAYPLLYTLSEATVVGIGITKKSGYSMAISVLALVINIVGNYVLIPFWGAKGAAVSTAISFWFFLVLRTEISSRIWRSVPRLKMYFMTLTCLVAAITFCFYGELYRNLFVGVWFTLLCLTLILYKKHFLMGLLWLKNMKKQS